MTIYVRIDGREDIPGAISQFELAGAGHRVPLLQALYHGQIGYLEAERHGFGGKLKRWMGLARRPAILLIGDDAADGSDTGPAGWPCTTRMTRWARRAIIHATGARREQYQLAVALAIECGRLAFIECGTVHMAEWRDVFAKAGVPTLTLRPPNGGVHPDPMRRERLQ